MSWQTTVTTIVRTLVNDWADPQTYSDSDIERVAVVAATFVQQEIPQDNVYSFDLATPDIVPDPEDLSDSIFINFVSLKAACLLDTHLFRSKINLEGLSAKAGPASMTVNNHSKGFKDLLELGPCKTYEKLKQEYQFGDSSIIKGIFSPFISDTFDPIYLTGYNYR